MSFLIPEPLESYAASKSTPLSSLFLELSKMTHEKTLYPQMQVGPVEGRLLQMLVRISKARRILEIGTFTGYSALAMAEGLPDDGEVVTLDLDPETTALAREFWKRSPHGQKIRLVLGPALESLAALEGMFDFVFIDADKENYSRYWELCIPRLNPGGLIVADNVLWSGKVLDPREDSDRAIIAFNDLVARDPRVETVMLTIRDGMTLARKK